MMELKEKLFNFPQMLMYQRYKKSIKSKLLKNMELCMDAGQNKFILRMNYYLTLGNIMPLHMKNIPIHFNLMPIIAKISNLELRMTMIQLKQLRNRWKKFRETTEN